MNETRGQTGAAARRERSRQEMITAIVGAAEGIVSRDGTDALTIRAVANALGYSPGALYEYFESKEAILCALYFHGTGGLDSCCVDIVQNQPADANVLTLVTDLGRTYRSFALDNAELYRLSFCGIDASQVVAEMASPESQTGSFGIIVQAVQRGISEGSIVDLPPTDIAFTLWSAIHGFVLLEITGHITGGDRPSAPIESEVKSRQDRDKIFETMLRTLLHGISTKEHATPVPPPSH